MPENRLSRYRSALFYLFKFIRPHKKWYVAASLSALLLIGTNLLQTKITAFLVDSSTGGKITGILISLCMFAVITVISIALNYISGISIAKLSANASKDMKCHICDRLLHAKYSEIAGRQSGDTLSTVNTDTSVVCDFIAGDLIGLFSQFSMALGASAYLTTINPLLCLVTFAYTPLGIFFSLSLNKKMNLLYSLNADYKGEALSVAEQVLSNIPVIKSFRMEKRVKNRIRVQYEKIYRTQMKISVWNALLQTACSTTAMIPQLLYLLFAGHLVMTGGLTVGTFIAAFDLLTYIVGPTVYFPFMLNSLNRSIASVNRIRRLEELEQEKIIAKHAESYVTPAIHIQDLSFHYDGNGWIFTDFSFTHQGTGIIAVCGESGSGKTTLFNIIAGLYKPQSGIVDVVGDIGVVSQDTYLFGESVMENIRLGNAKAGDIEIIAAAKSACADEFIRELPNGYETLLGDGNADLSVGQKQRISLARVMLSNASLWLLDEPTSALDVQTETMILDVIKQRSREKLILVSAHRKSLIDCADRIICLKGAEIG